MLRYVLKRILMMIPVLLAVSFVVYFLMDLAPGDIIAQMAPADATPETIEQMRKEMGLDGPLIQRYFRYVGKLLRGDLGESLSQKRPVMEIFMDRFPATLKLAIASLVVLEAIKAVSQTSDFDAVGRRSSIFPNRHAGAVLWRFT